MRRRGFLLIVSLLLLTILLVLGMGLMNSQTSRYRDLAALSLAVQAHELALSGFEDARSKLELNSNFPPNPAEDQPQFNYAEDVSNAINGKMVGSYEVKLDFARDIPPFFLVKVTSTGTVGPKEAPKAQRILQAELQRCNSATAANRIWRWVSLNDLGGL